MKLKYDDKTGTLWAIDGDGTQYGVASLTGELQAAHPIAELYWKANQSDAIRARDLFVRIAKRYNAGEKKK